MTTVADIHGVSFPIGGDGRRSTTATGRSIFADAARPVDEALTARIEHTSDWRSGYLRPVRDLVQAAAASSQAALAISAAGLESAHRRFTFERDGTDHPLSAAMSDYGRPAFGSVTVRGLQPRETDLSIPYRGRRLFGDPLRRQIDAWIAAGIAEPSFGQAMHLVLDNPDWLELADLDLVILGASAEMGPTRSLLRWGARVHAVDLPRPAIWEQLILTTRNTAGTLRIPIELDEHGNPPFFVGGPVHPDDDANVIRHAGADLIARAPEICTWIDEIPGEFVLGNYTYADGTLHARLSMAADAIAQRLTTMRDDVGLAYLATPTDAFMVPMAAVAESRRRWDQRGLTGFLQGPMRLLGQFEPNYPESYMADDGTPFGINDSLVPQQGPSYVLAKRIQRWRALVAGANGIPVSLNIAPATRTASVVRNRALGAAYAGASRFGVEVFEPATSARLMAALLVHDLRNPTTAPTASDPLPGNVMGMFAQSAIHGGLWRAAYSPRSVLGIAAVLGLINPRG